MRRSPDGDGDHRVASVQTERLQGGTLTPAMPVFSLLETMLWTPEEGLFLLDRHLARLQRSASCFSRALDSEFIRRLLRKATEPLSPVPHKVRLTVSLNQLPEVVAKPLSPLKGPYRIGLAKRPVDPSDPFLYHKTTHRTIYQRAMDARPGCDDVLLWNNRGEVTESCIANVLIGRDGRWFTPPVECGLLAGTYRSLLLERGEIEERVIRVEELEADTSIRLINSVRRAWRGRWVMSRDGPAPRC